MLRTPNLLFAKTIVETTLQRIAIDKKLIINFLPLLKPTDVKQEGVAAGINKAEYASLVLSCCYGYSLIYNY